MISVRNAGDSVIVDLEGFIHPENLQEHLLALLGTSGKKIALNLSRVYFTESNGLSALLNASKLCSEQGGNLILYGVQPYVQNLLEVTKLYNVITIKDTEQEALESLQA